jgi:hypothetical protein
LEEHPDGHKDPEKLNGMQRTLEQTRVINRASLAHAYFSAIDSGCKRSLGIPRSISAEDMTKVTAYQVEPAHVTVHMNVSGNHRGSVTVSERITQENLRRTIASAMGGHCRIQQKEFPVKEGTKVLAIPSHVPPAKTMTELHTPPVVPYLVYRGTKHQVEVMPDAPDELINEIATVSRQSRFKAIQGNQGSRQFKVQGNSRFKAIQGSRQSKKHIRPSVDVQGNQATDPH